MTYTSKPEYALRIILDDGINIELFDAGYEIQKRSDGTPSDFYLFNKYVAYTIPAFKVYMLIRTDNTGCVDAYMRADDYTLGRQATDRDWGWYTGTDY